MDFPFLLGSFCVGFMFFCAFFRLPWSRRVPFCLWYVGRIIKVLGTMNISQEATAAQDAATTAQQLSTVQWDPSIPDPTLQPDLPEFCSEEEKQRALSAALSAAAEALQQEQQDSHEEVGCRLLCCRRIIEHIFV